MAQEGLHQGHQILRVAVSQPQGQALAGGFEHFDAAALGRPLWRGQLDEVGRSASGRSGSSRRARSPQASLQLIVTKFEGAGDRADPVGACEPGGLPPQRFGDALTRPAGGPPGAQSPGQVVKLGGIGEVGP